MVAADSSAQPAAPAVIPRMVVTDPGGAVSFLRDVFGARGDLQDGRPTQVAIGNSVIMVSEVGAREAFPAFLYIYVEDADLTFRRAVNAGAISIEDPIDTPYGDRRAMVRDQFGNVFQIAHRR